MPSRRQTTPGTTPKNTLQPAELFDHRLAALLGCTVEEMLERLTPAQYHRWEVYWVHEPWGPWRDNLHAAIIAREVRAPYVRRGSQIDMDDFMIRRRTQDAENRALDSMRVLFAMAKPRGADKQSSKAMKRKRAGKKP